MRKTSVFLILALGFSSVAGAENLCETMQKHKVGHYAQPLTVNEKFEDPRLWTLEWHDEFDVPGKLNPELWTFELGGHGWGNKEVQYYTDREQNARVENGVLVIEARKEKFHRMSYTSARVNSVRKVTYGKIEFRTKLARGRGTWGAGWLLATNQVYGKWYWPDNGEIDVVETVGNENNLNHYSTHQKASSGSRTKNTYLDPVYEGDYNFHVYAVEWMPDSMRFLRDGEVKYVVNRKETDGWREWPFDQDMTIIMNMALGGFWGADKSRLDESIFEDGKARMEFDYVRVYRPSERHPGCTSKFPPRDHKAMIEESKK